MSTQVNNFGKFSDTRTKKRVSCPVIPFYNNVKNEKKEEENYNDILPDIKENSSDESSEEEIKNNFKQNKPKLNKKNNKNEKNELKEEKNNLINKEISNDYRKITGRFRNFNSFSLSSSKLSRQLKDILTQKLCLKDFSDWFNSVIISMQTDDLNEFITLLDCIQESDELTTEFFKYIYNLSKSKSKGYKYTYEAEKLYKKNKLGQICFITPEVEQITSIGKIGKTINDLSAGLCTLGQDVIIISPYYYQNFDGNKNYLENNDIDFKYIKDITISLDENYTFRIYYGINNIGIKYYFIENNNLFPKLYPNYNTPDTLRQISCFAKTSLQLLCDINVVPSIIVTNDWFTGLTPAYGKDGTFGDYYKNTKFIHLCHNLEPCYEGKLYFSDNNFQFIYQFDKDWLINPYSSDKIINPSRCAILKSDQWATLSKAYKRHLQLNSPLADILNQKPCPFGYPSGIFINEKLKEIKLLTGGNKAECKKYIQQKYFKYEDVDDTIPIYSYIGEINEDKGIMLILDSFEELIKKTHGKINILIIGNGNKDDYYYQNCANKINKFNEKYPYSFYGNINNKKNKDIQKIFLGSDYGLIPSKFEPNGIIQHEYFICETPVFAFKTGSLKDTVSEFNYQTNNGNGIIFDNFNIDEFIDAFIRSINLFKNKEKYEICCKNAKKSAIDISDFSKAWCKEFCKLKHKLFFDNSKIKDITMSTITDDMLIKEYKENESSINVRQNIVGPFGKKRKSNIFGMDSFHSGKNLRNKLNFNNMNENKNNYLQEDEIVKKFVFYYLNNYQPKVVEMSGSFDDWKKRHRLIHYPREKKWEISMKLKKGRYLYKYIIDGDWQINPREPSEKGNDGFINNVITL